MVGAVAMSASNMLNRANTLFNVGYGEDLSSRFPDMGNDDTELRSSFANTQSDYTDGETWTKSSLQSEYTDLGTSYTDLRNDFVNEARKLATHLEKRQ